MDNINIENLDNQELAELLNILEGMNDIVDEKVKEGKKNE